MRPDPRYELALASQVSHSQTEHPETSAVAVTNRSRPFFWRHTIVSQRLLTAYNTRCVSLHLCFSGVNRNCTLAVPTVYRNCTAYVPKLHRQNCHVPNATSFVPKLTCTEFVHRQDYTIGTPPKCNLDCCNVCKNVTIFVIGG